MAINKRAVLAAVTGAMLLGAASAPVSAQRYCQRELADDDARDEGCTAPVGGPIGKTDPSRSRTVSTTAEDKSDEQKLEELLSDTAQG